MFMYYSKKDAERDEINYLSRIIVDSCFEVHKNMDPDFLNPFTKGVWNLSCTNVDINLTGRFLFR